MSSRRKGAGQTALITGASGGIGLELARCFSRDGYDLVLVARSVDALGEAANDLSREFNIKAIPIACDLGRSGAVAQLIQDLEQRAIRIDVLVNNAGFGAAGAFDRSDVAAQLGMIDVNVRALVELTHAVWPRIMRSRRGGVLNVASTAAFQPGPFLAVYCASKAFVLSFTEALWEEARGSGVHVTCLCPGVTESGFHRRAGTDRLRLMRGGIMPATTVAEMGHRAFGANQRVKVTGFGNAMLAYSAALSPHAIVLRIARRLMSP
ncbi:MAG TPA: SDR family oxidoreductase [Xanthobacteraceae bacterium]